MSYGSSLSAYYGSYEPPLRQSFLVAQHDSHAAAVLVDPDNNSPTQSSSFSDRARKTSSSSPANDGIPPLLSTDSPDHDLHVTAELSPSRLGMHFEIGRALVSFWEE